MLEVDEVYLQLPNSAESQQAGNQIFPDIQENSSIFDYYTEYLLM